MSAIDPKLIAFADEIARAQGMNAAQRQLALIQRASGAALARVCANLQGQINTTNANLSSETSTRSSADSTITTDYQTADTSLQGQINSINSNITTLNSSITTLDNDKIYSNGVTHLNSSWGTTSAVCPPSSVLTLGINSPFGTTVIGVGCCGVDWQEATQNGLGVQVISGGAQLVGKHQNNNTTLSVTVTMAAIFFGN